MISILISNTYTKTGFLRRMSLLRSLLDKKNYSSPDKRMKKVEEFLKEKDAKEDDIEAVRSWVHGLGNKLDGRGFHATLNSLTEAMRSLPTVSLFVPILMPESELEKIGKWFRKYVTETMMLDVRVDPSYIGGCGIVYRGYFKDMSLRRLFLEKREEITQLIDGYEGSQMGKKEKNS